MMIKYNLKFSNKINRLISANLIETEKWSGYVFEGESGVLAFGAFKRVCRSQFLTNDILIHAQRQAEGWSHGISRIKWKNLPDGKVPDRILLWKQILDTAPTDHLHTDPVNVELCGTPFQIEVWKALLDSNPGEQLTYGSLAEKIRPRRGNRYARAVGQAVGANPVAFLVPCHRVVGARGDLRAFRWGVEFRNHLINLELEIGKQ
jgi:O-6-methylguanine DNA methyltransferase